MRLTIGSLPSAVYWRRRAMVLGAVVAVLTTGWFVLSGFDDSEGDHKKPRVATDAPSLPARSASPAESLMVPTIDESSQPAASLAATPSTVQANDQTVACTDAELLVTPSAEAMTIQGGQGTRLAIKIKNVSSRPCPRDLGADAQELYLQQGATKTYSSDACDPKHGTAVRMLAPGIEYMFTISWDGTSTAAGCAARQPLPAGQYQLVGRLGQKVSSPVVLTIT